MPHGAEVRAYAVATGAWVFSLVGHGARVSGVAPHPVDAGQVVTSSLDGTLRGWDAETGAARGAVPVGLPVARLAVPAGLPASAAPLVYVVAVGRYDASAAAAAAAGTLQGAAAGSVSGGPGCRLPLGYPLGDEVACLGDPAVCGLSRCLSQRRSRTSAR